MITEEQRQKILKALRYSYANLTAERTTEKEFENIIEAMEIVKNLIIPIVSQRSELFADQDSKEFILWQRDMQIQRIDNNVYKWREFTYNRDFFLEKYLEYRNKANCY
jgi:hypothetical protein